MKLFRDNFKPEILKGRGFLKSTPKAKQPGIYEVQIIRTPNGVYRYKTKVFLTASKKEISDDYYSHSADTKLGAIANARKVIKAYEKSLKKDEVIHREVW